MKKQIVGALMAAVALMPLAAAAQDRGNRAERVQARETRQAERATRVEARQQRGDTVQRNVVQRNGEQRQQMRAPRPEQVEQRRTPAQRDARRAIVDQRQPQRMVEQRRDGPVARQRLDNRNNAQNQAARANNQRWMNYDSDYRDRVQDRRDDRRDDRNWYNRSQFDQRGVQGRNNWQGQRGFQAQGNWQNQRGGWNRGWRNDNRYDWNRARAINRNAFRLPRYYAPNGWNNGYRQFGIGNVLSQVLFQQNYWINDPWSYSLPQAQEPYQWVRYYNDALLVDIYSGQVVDSIQGIFW